MGRFSFGLLVLLASSLLIKPESAQAYVPTISEKGAKVRWAKGTQLNLAGNPSNQNGIASADFFQAVVRGLQRWTRASDGAMDFDYWQGSDKATYETNSEYNGLSSIYFASNANGETNLDSNVLGLTQVWYDTDSGQILEVDIVLNDQAYQFTTDPRDTTGYGTTTANPGVGRRAFVENVITHELGHAFGFSHSGGLQSTMLFMESPEQAHLGCDDQVGMKALYPKASDDDERGGIDGEVESPDGDGVFGAHVVAISRRRGTVLASALTDKRGRYSIKALEPGTYYLMAEPFYAGAQALPAYYEGISSKVCSGKPFSRTFLLGENGVEPESVKVKAGSDANAPSLVVKCSTGGSAAVSSMSSSSSVSNATTIFDGAQGESGFGVVDRFQFTDKAYYRLSGVEGRLEIKALSYSLYSPVQPTLRLLDKSGAVVSTRAIDAVYRGESGFVNYDSALVAESLPRGDYVLQVTAKQLNASLYPAGPISLDSAPFLVISGSNNERGPSLERAIPYNARCRMDEEFPAYRSPGGEPVRGEVESEDGGGIGFCGSIDLNGAGGGGGSGPGAGAILGWFLPWIAMLAAARLAVSQLRARELALGHPGY